MPKILVHAPNAAFDARARQAIAADLTDFALECEVLPKSPFVKSTVWIYFNGYSADEVFMGPNPATKTVVSVQIYVIEGGLDVSAKKKLVKGATAIIGRHLNSGERAPVYIVIHDIAEASWGIFGESADLAALRASPRDAPAI